MAMKRLILDTLARTGIIAVTVMVMAIASANAQPPPTPPAGPIGRSPVAGTSSTSSTAIAHNPLDPLDPAEIQTAVEILRKDKRLPDSFRFVTVTLKEPPKEWILQPRSESRCPREVFVILLDNAAGRGYEAVVDLGRRAVVRYDMLPEGVQPPIMIDEFGECEEAARRSPEFRAACRKRGIEDLSLVMVNAWSAGHYGNEPPEDRGKRLCRALCWVRSEPSDNGYARPIEGLVVVIDLNRKEVLRVEDFGAIPLPPQAGNWVRQYNKETRTDLKPLEVIQPGGSSFNVRGQELSWQKWNLRIGFNPREGLVLHTIHYDGRPVLYRASISEMIVPYADPKECAYRKNAFDLGEYGVGMMANSLAMGCDCLGAIRYFDGHLADSRGRGITIKNAICVHEEDFGILWKHSDWRTSQSEVRRCAPVVRIDGRNRGQLRLRVLLVLLPGRHDPDGGEAHGDHELVRIEVG